MMGVEMGHGQAALCVAVPEWREDGLHFVVRFLEPLRHRVTYTEVAQRLNEVLENLQRIAPYSVRTYVNATDIGLPAAELICRIVQTGGVIPVEFNHGSRLPTERDDLTVLGKAWLVSRLQVLLQERRLHLPKDDPNARTLGDELLEYSHHPAPNADDLYGAFKVGTQDDLVNAIGLAVHQSPSRPWTRAQWEALMAALPTSPAGEVDEMLRRATGLPL